MTEQMNFGSFHPILTFFLELVTVAHVSEIRGGRRLPLAVGGLFPEFEESGDLRGVIEVNHLNALLATQPKEPRVDGFCLGAVQQHLYNGD